MKTTQRLVDADARDAIRTRLDVTMMVEAAAGTGKTTSLVDRMVALIRAGKCTVDKIAAITFTVKAAAHLRERFHEKLQTAVTACEGDERARIEDALSHLERCFIGTTHAFCARLLRERPVEAGIDPEFRELEESEARIGAREFYRAWLARASAEGNEGIAALRRAGIRPLELYDAFERLTHYPDVEIRWVAVDPPDLEAAFAALEAFLERVEPLLPEDSMRETADKFEELMRKLLQFRSSRTFETPSEMMALLVEANHKSRKPTQKNWGDTEETRKRAKNLGLEYEEFVVSTLRPAITAWYEYAHALILRFLEPAVSEYAHHRRVEGRLTFEDLLLAARDLLRDHPGVRHYFQKRFTHLLVDEFQDTDPLQAEVMFYLTGENLEERNWRETRPRPGSLFVVGDPKQSIYRFRRADITTYLQVRERIERAGGEVLQLSTNFRSFDSICDWVNRNFAAMFSGIDVEQGRQAAHVELSASRTGEPSKPNEHRGVYRLDIPAGKYEEIAEREAEMIARWIRAAVDEGHQIRDAHGTRPMRWSDVMLVSRVRTRLQFYARALEAAGIPYEVTGGRSFSKSEELAAITHAVRCLVDAEDGVALLAYLRGPFCGIDDQALYEFARAGGRFRLFGSLPAETDPRIRAAIELLRGVATESTALPPAATLARLFDRLGIFAHAALQPQHETRAGNLLLSLAYARRISAEGGSLAEVLEELEVLRDSESEVEELSIDPARPNAVRLMNLHQVKGLEAPVVFLIDPNSYRDFDVETCIDRSGESSIGHFALQMKRGKKTILLGLPQRWDDLQAVEQAFTQAEAKRLLYVAATRAMNMLVLGVQIRTRGDEGPWSGFPHRDLPPLPVPGDGEAMAADQERPTIDASAARARIETAYERSSGLSYSVLPITKLKKEHAHIVKHEEGLGRGTSWGRVMHRLLEAMLRDVNIDVALYASNLLKDEERDAAELDDVLRVIDRVTSSEIWSRIRQADERLVEVPFAISVNTSDLGIEGPPSTLLHGQIDLAFREGNRWYVIDYKSDITASRLDALVDYYRPQVREYTRWWQQLTGRDSTGGLFFVDSGDVIWL